MTHQASHSFLIAAQVVRRITSVLLFIAGTLFVLALLSLILDMILRLGYNTSVTGLHEAVNITFVYVFLLGASALYARNEDIVIEFFISRLPDRARRWLALSVYAAIALTMALVFVETVILIYNLRNTSSIHLRLPLAIMWIPLGIASLSIVYSSLVEAWASYIWIASGIRPAVWKKPRPE